MLWLYSSTCQRKSFLSSRISVCSEGRNHRPLPLPSGSRRASGGRPGLWTPSRSVPCRCVGGRGTRALSHGQNLPLQHTDATPLDLAAALQALPKGATGDFFVQTAPDKKQKLVAVRGRVILFPLFGSGGSGAAAGTPERQEERTHARCPHLVIM